MNRITLNCEIITPMFAGSAIPGRCELRPPAIKGALRFWWRALNAHKPWRQLVDEEAHFFGGTDEEIGRSGIQISINHSLKAALPSFKGLGKLFEVQSKGRKFTLNILDYLAYGAHEWDRNLRELRYIKPCFPVGQRFDLVLGWNNESAKAALTQALVALIQFGGLGTRTRNGWGKIAVGSWPEELKPTSLTIPKNTRAAFTGFSAEACLFQSQLFSSWDKAMGEVGLVYHDARLSLEPRHQFAKRIMVSQPIIDSDTQRDVRDAFLARHGKSLFLSVSKESGQYRGKILVLPYEFLDELGNSSLVPDNVKRNKKTFVQRYDTTYNHLISFFDSKLNKGRL